MQLKVQQVYDATLVISRIINDNRPMPQKGKYRLARMHAKLYAEYVTINERREAMIKAYDVHETVINAAGESVPTENFMVPAYKLEEFNAAWKIIGDEVIDVDVTPIPLGYLDLGEERDGSISSNEIITLGELVTE